MKGLNSLPQPMKWTFKLLFAVAILAVLSLVAMVSRQRMQSPAEVLDQVREVLRTDTYNEQVLLRRLGSAIRRGEASSEVSVEVCADLRLTRGELLLEIGAVHDAREDFELVLDLYRPGDSDVRRLLVRADAAAGDLIGALTRLDALLQDEPDFGPAWVDSGQMHHQLARRALEDCHQRVRYVLADEDAERAGELLERLAAQDPSDPARTGVILGVRELFPPDEEEVLAQVLISCEVASEELREARRNYVRSFTFDVDPVAVSGYLAILLAAGRSTEAIQLGNVASRLSPDVNETSIGELLIRALSEQGDLSHAADLAQQWSRSDVPLGADFLRQICLSLYHDRRWGPLLQAANRLHQLGSPSDQFLVALYRGFAFGSLPRANYSQAVSNLEEFARARVREPFPDARVLAWYLLARLHRENGDTTREREAIQAIVLAQPDWRGELWLRRAELQFESRHSGYQLPLLSWATGMSLLPGRTEELMDNFLQLGERALAAQDQDILVLYQSLSRSGQTIPQRNYGPYVLYRLAELHGEHGNPRGQALLARRLLQELPGFVPALDQLIEARLAQGNRAEYVELVVQRIELTGLNESSAALMDTIHSKEVDRSQLVRMMIADVKETGRLTVAFYLHQRGESEAALQTLEATEAGERTKQESLLAARILLENGKYQKALTWLDEVPDGGAAAQKRDRMALVCALQLEDVVRLRDLSAALLARPEVTEGELLEFADLFLRLGQPAGALQFLRSLETRPEADRGPVLLRLALIALHLDQLDLAGEYLLRAEAFAPEIEATVLRLLIDSRRGDWASCRQIATRLREEVPIDRPLLATMLALLEGEEEEALEIATYGVEIVPGVLGWHLAVNAAHLLQGTEPALDEDFGRAGPAETRLFLTGRLGPEARDPRETVALILASELPDFNAYVHAELAAMDPEVRGQLWPKLCLAYFLAGDGEYGEARPILEKLLVFADCLPVWDLLEDVLAGQLGSPEHPRILRLREQRSLAQAALDPDGPAAILSRARQALRSDSYENGLRAVRRVLRDHPDSEDALQLHAELLTEMQSWEEALAGWNALLLRAPSYAPGPGLPGLIDLLERSQKISPPGFERSAAIAELEQLAERFPTDPRVPLALARLDLIMDPSNPSIGVERAWLRLQEFRDAHPKTSLEELHRGAAGEWARFYVAMDPDAALEFIEAERLLQPGDIELWRLLGRVERELGDMPGSRRTLLHAAQMSQDARVLVELARTQVAMGAEMRVVSQTLRRARQLEGGPESLEYPLLEAECQLNQLQPRAWADAVTRLEPLWEQRRQRTSTETELARLAGLFARALLLRHAEGDVTRALDVLQEAQPAAEGPYQLEFFRSLAGLGRSTMAVSE